MNDQMNKNMLSWEEKLEMRINEHKKIENKRSVVVQLNDIKDTNYESNFRTQRLKFQKDDLVLLHNPAALNSGKLSIAWKCKF